MSSGGKRTEKDIWSIKMAISKRHIGKIPKSIGQSQEQIIKNANKMKSSEITQKYQKLSIEEISNQPPATIYGEIVILASSIGENASLLLIAEQALSLKWEATRKETETDKQCDSKIKQTQEYANVQLCRANERMTIEMIRSLKKLLSSKSDEAKNYY